MFSSTKEDTAPTQHDIKGKNRKDINWPIRTDVRRVEVLYPKHEIKSDCLTTTWLTISSLGIIYGDIGTSPLYVVQSMFTSPPSEEDVYGGVSLIIWALTLVATIKYISIILNFNNNGEGGIFALMAMLPFSKMGKVSRGVFATLAIFGSALLIGDGVITPAISVLSAVEGLNLGIHGIKKYEQWIAAFVSTLLPTFSPVYGIRYIGRHGADGYLFLGVVVLCVTGVEAMYADLGHFGAKPIRCSWFFIVYPALLLNYIGQGALLIKDPSRYDNPFYHLVPHMFFWPMIVLATVATVIASQSIITGSFSLVGQAISFGYFPRMKVKHTSEKVFGQIYIPELNFLLMVLTIVITILFKTSSKLTAAYGLAVSGVMFLTSIIFTAVLRYRYKTNWALVILYAAVFYTVDIAFLGANSSKVPSGGWLPLAIGSTLALLMIIWKTGKEKVETLLENTHIPLDNVLKLASTGKIERVPMVGVYLNAHYDLTPLSLSLLLPRARSLASPAIFLTVKYLPVPYVSDQDRILFHSLDEGDDGTELNTDKDFETEQVDDDPNSEEMSVRVDVIDGVDTPNEHSSDDNDLDTTEKVENEDGEKSSINVSTTIPCPYQIVIYSAHIYRVIASYGYSEVVDLPDVVARVLNEHPIPRPPLDENPTDEQALMISPNITFFLNRERIKTNGKRFILHRWWVYCYSILLRNARGVVDLFNLPYDSIVQVSAPVLL